MNRISLLVATASLLNRERKRKRLKMQVTNKLCNVFVGGPGTGKSVALVNTLAAEAKQDRFSDMHFFIYSDESDVERIMNTVNAQGVTREYIVCPSPEVLLEELTKLRDNIERNKASNGKNQPRITLFVDACSTTRFSRERSMYGRSVEFNSAELRACVDLVDRLHVTMSLSKT